jgi:adenylate kinase
MHDSRRSSPLAASPAPHSAILLLGPTGSGKTPLGELLEQAGWERRRCFHFDFGANLRAVGEGRARLDELSDEDVAIAVRAVRTGALLEDREFHVARNILLGWARQSGVGDKDIIVLNGLPRHVGQAKDVDSMVNVCAVLYLICPTEVVLERIRVNAGGDRGGREDDAIEAVTRRLRLFEARTVPLLDHYAGKGVRIERVDIGVRTTPHDILRELSGRD